MTINYDGNEPTVSARELHKALEVNTDFNHWFTRMCEYGFEDGKDFATFLSESTGGRPSQDAQITVDMAKEIAMLQRTEKGKEVRKYFIQIEKEWNSPERVMARALTIANKTIETLKIENSEMKPKALFADAVAASNSNILIGDLAKLIKQNGHDIGQKRLFDWLRDNGYLIKYGSSRNMPTQLAMNLGLFKVKESTFSNPDGSVRITKTTKVTGKGQQYFINKFLGS